MTPWRRHLRRLRLWLVRLCALALIAMALAMGLGQLALPWVVSHPEKVTAFLSEKLHRPVSIDKIEGRWERSGPVLTLNGLHLGAADPSQQAMLIPQAGIALNFFAWLHKNQRWNEFRLDGLDLVLSHDAPDGSWRIHGFTADNNDQQDDGDNPLFQLGSLVLRDLHLRVDDTPDQRQLQFAIPELRLINNGSAHRLLARVQSMETQSPPMTLVAEYDADSRDGRLYLGSSQLDLAGLLRLFPVRSLAVASGIGDAQFWVDWRAGSLGTVRTEIDLRNLVLQTTAPIDTGAAGDIVPRISLDRLAFGARLQNSAQGWRADIADLRMDREGQTGMPGLISIEQRNAVAAPVATAAREGLLVAPVDDLAYQPLLPVTADLSAAASALPEYLGSASDLDLSALASLSMLSDALPAGLRQWLYNASPHAVARNVSVRYRDGHDYDVAARINSVSWMPVGKLPGIEGLSLEAHGDAAAMSISLPTHAPLRLPMPQVFRSTLELAELSGNLAAYRTDNSWRIEIPHLLFEGQPVASLGYGGELRGAIDLNDDGSRPFLDIYAAITHADILAMHQFWPYNNMPKQGVAWLDRGLAGGHLSGRAAFRGNLGDWPFRTPVGQFSAHVDLEDATLDYNPEWPRVDHLRASADFLNTSLHVATSAGQTLGNTLTAGTADISDFAHAIIEIQLGGEGSGKSLLDFLHASPIGKRYADQLRGVDISGSGKLALQLHLPLGNDQGPLRLDGSVDMTDADLSASGPNLRLTQANGKVVFSERGFGIDDMAVRYEDQPARFALRVGSAYMRDPQHQAEASLHGKLPAAILLKRVPVLLPYQKFIDGSADWTVDYNVDDNHGKGDSAQRLILSSDLKGVAITLPAPMHKDSNEIQPLRVIVPLPFEGGELQARLGDIAQMRARLEKGTTPFAGHLAFGAGMPDALPKRGLRVSGGVVEADISGWMDFVVGNSSSGSGSFIESVDLRVAQLTFFGRAFPDTAFKLSFSPDESTINLSGSQLQGTVHIPAADLIKRGVTAELERLYMPPDSDDAAAADANAQTVAVSDTLAGVNPAAIPPLHISVGDLHLGHASFGSARVESYPIEGGMHLEQVQSDSPNIDMSARGDWLGKGGKDHSAFSIHFTAKNLGHMLDALGYAGVIDGGETVVGIDASWPGAPSSFALPKLEGTLDLAVADGRILQADPGAGRIIGLFGITEISRRLTLDFSDIVKSGLAFNSIKGKFALHNGSASTSDLQIKGPAADIAITGRTDLRKREYDQTMQVMPHLGNTLPIVGALAGGPIGAAAGFVVQTILRKPLNQAGETTYRVTGSWDKPVTTVVARTTSRTRGKDEAKADKTK